jgi:recombination protein RecA
LDLGVQAGIVEKSGSWFSYDGQRIGQGRENAKAFLKEHPGIADEIDRKVRENAGLVASAMLEGAEDDKGEDDKGEGDEVGEGETSGVAEA